MVPAVARRSVMQVHVAGGRGFLGAAVVRALTARGRRRGQRRSAGRELGGELSKQRARQRLRAVLRERRELASVVGGHIMNEQRLLGQRQAPIVEEAKALRGRDAVQRLGRQQPHGVWLRLRDLADQGGAQAKADRGVHLRRAGQQRAHERRARRGGDDRVVGLGQAPGAFQPAVPALGHRRAHRHPAAAQRLRGGERQRRPEHPPVQLAGDPRLVGAPHQLGAERAGLRAQRGQRAQDQHVEIEVDATFLPQDRVAQEVRLRARRAGRDALVGLEELAVVIGGGQHLLVAALADGHPASHVQALQLRGGWAGADQVQDHLQLGVGEAHGVDGQALA